MTLREQFALKMAEARAAYEAGDVTKGDELKAEAERLQSAMKGVAALDGLEDAAKAVPMRVPLPGTGAGSMPAIAPGNGQQAQQQDENPSVKALYTMRFGEDSAMKTAVMTDLVGREYRQIVWDQARAFAKFLRKGDRFLTSDEFMLLQQQIFPFETIHEMVRSGHDVASIKSTMVEAQGTLGGFAVPPTLQSEILQRLPGLTAVRGGGATIVNLTTGNSTEWIEITGGDDRYTSAIRGAWGAETQAPAEKNLTLGMKQINADVYTYKVPMSQSLVEDAANLVTILQEDAQTTMAIDEDDAFLVGDGAGKPLGLLPGGNNSLSIAEVNSGAAAALTFNGLIALTYGIAAQYRASASWVGERAAYQAIGQLTDGTGQYLWRDQFGNNQTMGGAIIRPLLGYITRESEAMSSIGANAYPLLFGAMRGYTIVERSGMTIARYQDSNTGINKVEFHFRRRVGGRPTRAYMFAVQKVAA